MRASKISKAEGPTFGFKHPSMTTSVMAYNNQLENKEVKKKEETSLSVCQVARAT